MQRCLALSECQLLGTYVIGIRIGLRPRPNGLLRRGLSHAGRLLRVEPLLFLTPRRPKRNTAKRVAEFWGQGAEVLALLNARACTDGVTDR